MKLSIDNDRERLLDQVQQGRTTAAEANVQMVLNERFRLVRGRMIQPVRKALNEAVKAGKLGHIKKDGFKPEAYYNPTFAFLAHAARNKADRDGKEALKRVAGWPVDEQAT